MKTNRTTSHRNTLAMVTARPLLAALVIAALAAGCGKSRESGGEHPQESPTSEHP